MIYLAAPLILLFSFFLPWWGFIPPCFAVGLKGKNILNSFLTGFISVSAIWLIASYSLNIKSHGLMAKKMSLVLPLGGSSWGLLIAVAVFGGVLGGLWSTLGYVFYQRVWKMN